VITTEVDLFTEPLGQHALAITATDQAGWVSTTTQQITLIDAAQRSIEKGKDETAINQLNAFINEVEAQRDKKITLLGADLMIYDAQVVIDLLEKGEYQAMEVKDNRVYLPVFVKE
jgi:hypothetical protein